MSSCKTSIGGISRVYYVPIKECNWAVLMHKKGEKYVDWSFKFPFRHVKTYQENLYADKYWYGWTDYYYTEKELLERHKKIVKDGKVYDMCHIKIVFLDGSDKYEYFNTDSEGLDRYYEICTKFQLKPFDSND